MNNSIIYHKPISYDSIIISQREQTIPSWIQHWMLNKQIHLMQKCDDHVMNAHSSHLCNYQQCRVVYPSIHTLSMCPLGTGIQSSHFKSCNFLTDLTGLVTWLSTSVGTKPRPMHDGDLTPIQCLTGTSRKQPLATT